MTLTWEFFYRLLGIEDFIYFISSPIIQETLFPVKILFIFFTFFFLFFVLYFYWNSSYIQNFFLQDTIEFLSWQPYGLRQINNRWKKIMKRLEMENVDEYKLAIVEADDFLYKVLEDKGYQGDSFEEIIADAGHKISPSSDEVLRVHRVRNSIVYDANYMLTSEYARSILGVYERAIKGL